MAGYSTSRTQNIVSCIVHAQLVFVTRYRHPVFTARHLERTEEIMRAVCTDFETGLAESSGETSHVHLLVNFPPKLALSRLVNSLKGLSSRRLRQGFPELRRHYCKANRLWSGSYLAGSAGGAPVTVLRQYIEQQDRPPDTSPGPSAFTSGLKAGALADILVAGQDVGALLRCGVWRSGAGRRRCVIRNRGRRLQYRRAPADRRERWLP